MGGPGWFWVFNCILLISSKLKKKTRKLSSKALGLSFYLLKLYKINNVSYIVMLNNNKQYIYAVNIYIFIYIID